MKIGCVAAPGDCDLILQAGYDYAELSGRYVYGLEPEAYRSLVTMVRGSGLPCLGLNAFCPPRVRIAGPGFSARGIREYAQALGDRAAELGVKYVGVGSPRSRDLPEGFDRKIAFLQAAEFFAITGEAFAPFGITVCVEALGPCYCNFINRLWEAKDLLLAAGMDNVRLVIDFYNMEHVGEADMDLESYLPYIAHAHISDDAGGPDKRWFLKSEKREIHLARVKRLKDLGYRGGITVETDLPADLSAAAETLAILRESIE
jgi:sugar phosphate isomerase/epimerase